MYQGRAKARVISTLLLVFSVSTAQAGTVLKLNSGHIDTSTLASSMSISETDNQVTEYIVQYKEAITEADKKALRSRFEVFGYLPEDALVVRGTAAKLAHFQKNNPRVQAVVKYHADFKVSQDFSQASVFNRDQFEDILITTFAAADLDAVIARMKTSGIKVKLQHADGRSIYASIPRGDVSTIAGFAGVEHMQPAPVIESFHFAMDENLAAVAASVPGDYSDLTGDEPGTRVMKFEEVWSKGFAGHGQIVAMADTGLDSGDLQAIHQDFAGGVTSGRSFGLYGRSWADPMGHGTHVAGSVMGRGTASQGLLKGAAYEAKMAAQSLWSPMLNNLSIPSKMADLFNGAAQDGASIHTNSWGSARSFGAYDNFAMQVDEWAFNNPDMLILFAAGNSGTDKNRDGRIDANSIASPGTAKNVLTVGASENVVTTGGIQVPINRLKAATEDWPANPINSDFISNNENGLAMFSSRGPTADGRIKPDIVAPGTNILSVRSQQKGASPLWGAYNEHYAWSGGTSMSTPLTAGAAAVARQVLIAQGIATPSAALLKATMLHTAVDMFPGQFGEVGEKQGQEILIRRPNSDEGYGRVDMTNIANLHSGVQFIDNRAGVAQGASDSYTFTVTARGNFYANLVWTDAPASSNAAKALVNDLDMTLTTPSGQKISMNDHTNNLEMLEMVLEPGVYTLSVTGTKVPQGKNGAQPYALVYSVK